MKARGLFYTGYDVPAAQFIVTKPSDNSKAYSNPPRIPSPAFFQPINPRVEIVVSAPKILDKWDSREASIAPTIELEPFVAQTPQTKNVYAYSTYDKLKERLGKEDAPAIPGRD